MAQHVSFWQNDIVYTEGPFVVTDMMDTMTIEVEQKGHYTCVWVSDSVYNIMERLGWKGNTSNRALADGICDVLNKMVVEGKIVRLGRTWVSVEYYDEVYKAAEDIPTFLRRQMEG